VSPQADTERVLVVEDEPGLLRTLEITLRARGYQVASSPDGRAALAEAARRPPDAVLLDLGLPDLDGTEIIRRLRAWTGVPVLVLTGRGGSGDKIGALDAGADDYVTKPFGMEELLARTRALLRRRDARAGPAVLRWADIAVDPESRTVTKSGRAIHLTPTEFALLAKLAEKPGAVWTHRQLLAAVWGTTAGVTHDTLRVHMGSLRRKLEDDPNRPRWILTEPWVGYRFNPER